MGGCGDGFLVVEEWWEGAVGEGGGLVGVRGREGEGEGRGLPEELGRNLVEEGVG